MLSSVPTTPTFLELSDKLSLRYQKTGDGPPLVLMHTIRTQLEDFRYLAPLLADSFTVYAVDLPGHGIPPSIPRRPTMSRISDKASLSSSSGSTCVM